MIEKEFVLNNKTGLHARPAGELSKLLAPVADFVEIEYKGKKSVAKSILNLIALGLVGGATFKIIVDGETEVETMKIVEDFFANIKD